MRIGFINSLSRGQYGFDDRLLAEHCQKAGHEPVLVFWDDETSIKKAACDVYINRSTFDYHLNIEGFNLWLEKARAENLPLLNPPQLMRWNGHKSYLKDLRSKGMNIIDTLFIEEQSFDKALALILETGWEQIVCKPFVGAAGVNLFKIKADELKKSDLTPFLNGDDTYSFIVQPFMKEAADFGELSFIFFGAEFSHTVLKKPANGDYRVNGKFGATVQPYDVNKDLTAQAKDMMMKSGLSEQLLYARIDCLLRDDKLYLNEFEINEPWLFFTESPKSCAFFLSRLEQMSAAQFDIYEQNLKKRKTA